MERMGKMIFNVHLVLSVFFMLASVKTYMNMDKYSTIKALIMPLSPMISNLEMNMIIFAPLIGVIIIAYIPSFF